MIETTAAVRPSLLPNESRGEYDARRLHAMWAADERSRVLLQSDAGDPGLLNGRPISNRNLSAFHRPSPALTPAQRLHLDVYGYVVIENVLTPAEVEQLRNDIYDIERRFRAGDSLETLKPTFLDSESEDYFRIDNLPHIAPSFFDYVTHPRLVGMAEEAIGGPARLSASDAHIRRAPADPDQLPYTTDGFHRGSHGMAGTIANGLYHFSLVNTLTNLTDLGEGDGGTMLIPGTHKLPGDLDRQAIVDAAMGDPSLIHHVEAPAGSTLLFFETLLHSGGIIRSGKDRVLVVSRYTPPMFATYSGNEPASELVRHLPEDYQHFFLGWHSYKWPGLKARSLADWPSA
jgi:ectoine hydroxylase-related dioxygenase (phytanoyl-CoA dioxygenase family)